jgi:hypothetical protein
VAVPVASKTPTTQRSMESQKRTELVDALLEEARQMITVPLKASTAQSCRGR